MKTRIRTQIRHALVIRAIDLRAIWSVLGEVYTKISATARCLDGSILETNDIDEIVVFDNPSFRRIESLEFEARTKLDESVEIQIRGDTSALLLIVGIGMWSVVTGQHIANATNSSTFETITHIAFFSVLCFAVTWPLDRLQRWLFPRVFFALGRQAEELIRREKWRSTILIGFVLSVLASLLAAFIYARF